MKKNLALVLALVLCLSLFAGCTPAPTGGEPAKGAGVELTVVTSYGGDDGNRQNYETAVKSFEEASGNTVLDASATSNEEWKAKVLTDFQAGTEPDVLFYFTAADADPIVEAGKVVPLSEIRAEYPEYGKNFNDGMLPRSSADGEQYAIPVTAFWEAMFVNTKVLEQANVAVPGADYTWDQFLADCEAIKGAGFTPIAVSLNEVPHYWFEFAVYNNGNKDNHLEIPAAATDEVGAKWASGLNDIKSLYDLGYLPANTLTMGDADSVQMVYDGKAAFFIDGNWKVGNVVENNPDNLSDFTVTYVPAKGERAATDLIGGYSMGYYITRKAWDDPEKRAAAVAFVEHMTANDVIATFTSDSTLQTAANEMVANATSLVMPVQDMLSQEVRGDLFANIPQIAAGNVTAEQAIDQALAIG